MCKRMRDDLLAIPQYVLVLFCPRATYRVSGEGEDLLDHNNDAYERTKGVYERRYERKRVRTRARTDRGSSIEKECI